MDLSRQGGLCIGVHMYLFDFLVTIMAKTIAVSDDVYELLKKVRLPGESFSDVIRRGLGHGVKLTDIYGSGTISKADWVRVRKTIRHSEEISRRKLDRMFH